MNIEEPYLLFIETATEICSIALAKRDRLIAAKESGDGYSHSKKLIPFIATMLEENRVDIKEVGAVVLSAGPGSYTGLRIGASSAKGICYALDIPLIALPTLQNIMMCAKDDVSLSTNQSSRPLLYCPMIDARRMEVYTALYDQQGAVVKDITAMVIDEKSFAGILEDHDIIFCGNGMPKCRALLENHGHARFSEMPLSATGMIANAWERYKARQFEDAAYFEPLYLKEYVAAKPVVKGLY